MSRGLEWQYINQTVMRPLTIEGNDQFQLPRSDYTFSYPEGVIIQFSAMFDHPKCGLRIESYPNFDTGTFFTVNNFNMLGMNRMDLLVYTAVPPITPAGTYTMRIGSPWSWRDWLRLYLVNTDTVQHKLLAHGYHIAVVKKTKEYQDYVGKNSVEVSK